MVQALAAGHSEPGTAQYVKFAAQLPSLFAPSPRLAHYGLTGLANIYRQHIAIEALATFGVVLTALAALGLAVSWQRHGARALRRCGPAPHPVPGHPPVHPARPDLARAAGIAADAGHLADPAARAVLVPRAGPAGAARPGRGRHPGRGGGGVAGPAQPPCADR